MQLGHILPIFISIFFLVVAQLTLKVGMNQVGPVDLGNFSAVISLIGKVFTTPAVFTGVVLYVVSSFFWLIGISKVELSYAYPFVGLAYVFVVLFSWIFLKEAVTLIRWIGVFLIITGVYLVSRS